MSKRIFSDIQQQALSKNVKGLRQRIGIYTKALDIDNNNQKLMDLKVE